jgi:sulfate/thiosulfate transport system ATP-binding protein
VSVSVTNVSKRFSSAGLPAVHDVSFTAPTGSITSLLGPSGSGKTTLLRLIAGLEKPDVGTVSLGGEDCTRVAVQKRGVGFVFQGYALFQHLSVRKNIAFGMKVAGTPAEEMTARIDELLALVQLEDLGHRYPAQLSGGQRQRVAFARALATRPRVLLLDEPFGALDARVRMELREWLRELHAKTHVTTVLVTHDQDEALELSSRVVVMHEGKVEQDGSPQEVYDHPRTPFVASFIGRANVVTTRIEAGRASVGATSLELPAGAAEGSAVSAFVRPHDVKLQKAEDGAAAHASMAHIEALTRVGAYVKVELKLSSAQRMSVQIPRGELDAMGVTIGDRVIVDVAGAKIFVGDYSI